MNAVLYARVSTKEQEETGFSLDSQEKLLREYASQKNLSIAKAFRISESASGKIQRKTFKEMNDYIKAHGIKIILCEKTDRLTRNLKDAYEINEWVKEDSGNEIHFVKENVILNNDSKSNEKFIWNIKVSVAQYYIDNLSEEVKKGQKEKIAQGGYPSCPPLGYRSEGEKGHRIHIPDDSVAPYIRRMFDLYATGLYSLEKIAVIITSEGLRSRKGREIKKRTVHEILTNIYYTGRFKWNGELHRGQHEAIVSQEQFNLVQNKLTGKKTPLVAKRNYLFRGLIRCIHCGTSILWESHKGTIYGHCNYRHSKCDYGKNKWVKEDAVYQDIAEKFGELAVSNPRIAEWIRESLQESHHDEVEYRETKIKELNALHSKLAKRLDRLYEDRLDEVIPDELYREKFAIFTEQKTEIVSDIKKLSEGSDKQKEVGLKVFEFAENAKAKFLKKTPEEKRKLVNGICEKIELEHGKVKVTYNLAFNILSKAVLATNSSDIANSEEISDEISEPSYLGLIKQKRASSDSLCSIWRTRPDSNWRPPQ